MRKISIALLLSLPAITVALAHSWYDSDCCSENDCHEVSADQVEEVKSGYWIYKPTQRAFNSVRPSRDGKFHICIAAGPAKTHRCIYIVQGV